MVILPVLLAAAVAAAPAKLAVPPAKRVRAAVARALKEGVERPVGRANSEAFDLREGAVMRRLRLPADTPKDFDRSLFVVAESSAALWHGVRIEEKDGVKGYEIWGYRSDLDGKLELFVKGGGPEGAVKQSRLKIDDAVRAEFAAEARSMLDALAKERR